MLTSGLLIQLLDWVAAKPRTYREAMDAWRTSCPRMPVWEDALLDGLVEVVPAGTGGLSGAIVRLTPKGTSVRARPCSAALEDAAR